MGRRHEVLCGKQANVTPLPALVLLTVLSIQFVERSIIEGYDDDIARRGTLTPPNNETVNDPSFQTANCGNE
jgi:hypothetical protein